MTYIDDAGKEKLTSEEIEEMEDQGLDPNKEKDVDTFFEDYELEERRMEYASFL